MRASGSSWRTTREVAIGIAGAFVGVWIGWVGLHATSDPVAAPRAASAPAAPAPRLAERDPAIATAPAPGIQDPPGDDATAERVARLRAEKERDTLAAELAALRSSTAAFTRAMGSWGEEGLARPKLEKLSPDEAAKRLASIGADVDGALRSKDREVTNKLLRELARLGRPGWPLIEKLMTARPDVAPSDDDEDEDGEGRSQDWGLRTELAQLVAEGELKDLALDALLHPESYSAEFRRMFAIGAYNMAASPEDQPRLIQLLATEKDPEVLSYALSGLLANKALDGQALVSAIRAQTAPDARSAMVSTIVGMGSEVSTSALRDLERSESDARIQRTLRHAITEREPPVQGYLVSNVTKGSQAELAGMQDGDIIVSYNGVEVKSVKHLAKLKQGVAPEARVAVTVFRDGTMIPLTLGAGQIGVNGQVVKPAGSK